MNIQNYDYLPRQQWGPIFWACIHHTCLGFPIHPTQEEKEHYILFLKALLHVIPCIHCKTHYAELLEKIPIEYYIENRSTLFEWSVAIHNAVSQKRGQEVWTIQEALKQWTNRYEKPL